MSYQLDLDKGKKPEIAMPPLPGEMHENQGENSQDMSINQGEISQDVVENVDNSAQAAPEASNEPVQEQPKVGPQESFSRLRKERDEMARRLAAYESKQYPQQYPNEQSKPAVQDEPEYNINDDDLLEGKHLKQYAKKIQQLEQKLYSQQQQTSTQLAQAQIRAKFPDFDRVVNEDNIEHLRYAYPELANTLNSSTDLYSTAVSAYTMIKNLGIVPKEDFMAQKAQAQKNAAKPKPLASVNPQQGDSPLSKANAFANGLTDDLKMQLRKEMEQARQNH